MSKNEFRNEKEAALWAKFLASALSGGVLAAEERADSALSSYRERRGTLPPTFLAEAWVRSD